MTTVLLTYALVGAIAGILAGLFGIGGGLVIVPMLVYCFTVQHINPDLMMQIALGTSMASILFTATSSFMAHHKRGAVDWSVVRKIVVGILLGTYLGSFVASRLSSDFLKGFFVLFLYYVAWQMISGKKPKPSRHLPGGLGITGVGGGIGIISSLVGIGGGTLSVPFLVWCNTPLHRAIGTSAAIGFPIALAGSFGYVVNGTGVEGRPEWSLGFVYLPALIGIVVTSVFTAPIGVRLAHSLPVPRLKKAFAVLLLVVATKMLFGLF
ncbi:sulfite exporter TauE/SafE family protein [Desulfocurvus sp. DL9XJH121]